MRLIPDTKAICGYSQGLSWKSEASFTTLTQCSTSRTLASTATASRSCNWSINDFSSTPVCIISQSKLLVNNQVYHLKNAEFDKELLQVQVP